MNTRDLVELATLIGGIIVSVLGAVNQIRSRKADDKVLAEAAGKENFNAAKTVSDIVSVDSTYMQQVQAQMDGLNAKLSAAETKLREHGITR